MNPPVHAYRQAIAAEVRAAMGRAGINQAQLAERMTQPMSRATLSDRLSGKRAFNTDQLLAIAEVLGVDPMDFLVSRPIPTAATS